MINYPEIIFKQIIQYHVYFLMSVQAAVTLFFEKLAHKDIVFDNRGKEIIKKEFLKKGFYAFYKKEKFEVYKIFEHPINGTANAIKVLEFPVFIENKCFHLKKSGQYINKLVSKTFLKRLKFYKDININKFYKEYLKVIQQINSFEQILSVNDIINFFQVNKNEK